MKVKKILLISAFLFMLPLKILANDGPDSFINLNNNWEHKEKCGIKLNDFFSQTNYFFVEKSMTKQELKNIKYLYVRIKNIDYQLFFNDIKLEAVEMSERFDVYDISNRNVNSKNLITIKRLDKYKLNAYASVFISKKRSKLLERGVYQQKQNKSLDLSPLVNFKILSNQEMSYYFSDNYFSDNQYYIMPSRGNYSHLVREIPNPVILYQWNIIKKQSNYNDYLYIKEIEGADEIFINSNCSGRDGVKYNLSKSYYDKSRIHNILLRIGNNDLLIKSYPSSRNYSGFIVGNEICIGDSVSLYRKLFVSDIQYGFISIFCILCGLYLIIRTILNFQNDYLFAGIFVIFCALYVFLQTDYKYFFTNNFLLLKRCEYLLLTLIVQLFSLFIKSFYKDRFKKKKYHKIFNSLYYTYLTLMLFFPAFILYSNDIDSWHDLLTFLHISWMPLFIFSMVPVMHESALYLIACVRKISRAENIKTEKINSDGLILFFGMIILLVCSLNDIVLLHRTNATMSLLPYGIIFFIFSIMIVLSLKTKRINVENVYLSSELIKSKDIAEERAHLLENVMKEISSLSEELLKVSSNLCLIGNVFRGDAYHQKKNSNVLKHSLMEVFENGTSILDSANEQTVKSRLSFEATKNLKEIQKNVSNTSYSIIESIQNASSMNSEISDSLYKMDISMNKVKRSGNQICKISDIMDDFSEQINLLSLNASIEAARAGKYGVGFAVVAEEIGKLARSTGEKSKSIKNELKQLIIDIDETSFCVNKSSNSIMEILNILETIIPQIDSVLEKMKEQDSVTEVVTHRTEKVVELANKISSYSNAQKNSADLAIEPISFMKNMSEGIFEKCDEIINCISILQGKSGELNNIIKKAS